MEFHEKLQELRKNKGLTQEQLAEILYVSRTAVSKWESGRGYPNIESLKAIAKCFSVTVDELISTDEIIQLAEDDGEKKKKSFRNLIFGLLDISAAILIFLPLFAERKESFIYSVSLLELASVQPYLKALFCCLIAAISVLGVLTLALQNCQKLFWIKSKAILSLALGVALVLVFILSLQPYAACLSFILLTIKAVSAIKR